MDESAVRRWGLFATGMLLLAGSATALGTRGSLSLLSSFGRVPLAAATALGNVQGAPPNGVNKPYPDDTTCYYLLDGKYPYTSSPGCWGSINHAAAASSYTWPTGVSGGNTYYSYYTPIYTGIFSINAATNPWSGYSVYLTSTYSTPYEDDKYLGSVCSLGGSLVPQSGDTGPVTWGCAQNELYYPANCSQFSVPPGFSGVRMTTPSGGGEAGYSAYCYAWRNVPGSLGTSQTGVGSTPSVAAGGQLTIAWSCLPSRTAIANGCSYNLFDSHCNAYQYTQYSIGISSSASGGGPGFGGGGITGSQTITAPSTPGTYTYSLTCNSGYGLPTMSIAVSVSDPCPTAAWQPWGNGVYVIEPYATRRVAGAANFCVTNSSGNYIVVPGGGSNASGQLSTFRSYSGNVGAVTF